MKRGVTLVELLIVLIIIIVLAAIIFPGYQSARLQLALLREANRIAQNIRKAQEMAMGTKEKETDILGSTEIPKGGYGIYFEKGEGITSYSIYADKNGNEYYRGTEGDEIMETIDLEKVVYIKEFVSDSENPNKISINFRPPDPRVKIEDTVTPGAAGAGGYNNITITIALRAAPGKTKNITVNKVGLITVE